MKKYIGLMTALFCFGLFSYGQESTKSISYKTDSIKMAYWDKAAIDYPLLRQGWFSTEAMARVHTRTDEFGTPQYKSTTGLTREKAFFTIPVLQWGTNSLSASISYVNQHYTIDHIQNLTPERTVPNMNFNRATTGLALTYARTDPLFGRSVRYSGTLNDFTDDLSAAKRVTFLGTVIFPIYRTSTHALSVGAAVILDPSTVIPVLPIISYWYKFPSGYTELFVDLPNRITIRSQLTSKSWIAFGTELNNSFAFFHLNDPALPKNATWSLIELKTGPSYEIHFSRYLVLGLYGGFYSTLDSRISKDNASRSDYFIRNHTNTAPYINIGISLLPFTKPIRTIRN